MGMRCIAGLAGLLCACLLSAWSVSAEPLRKPLPGPMMEGEAKLYRWLPEKANHPWYALFSTLIVSENATNATRRAAVLDAARLICTARAHGTTLKFHLNYGGGLEKLELAVLRRMGYIVEMYKGAESVGFVKKAWKPICSKSQAEQKGRKWADDHPVQCTEDGWMSYFKFYTWQQLRYGGVVHVDLGQCFTGNPDPSVQRQPEVAFRAGQNEAHGGMDSSVMWLTPHDGVFTRLTQRAAAGDYVPRSNTAEDILEAQFSKLPESRGGAVVPHARAPRDAGAEAECDNLRLLTCETFMTQCWPSKSHCNL